MNLSKQLRAWRHRQADMRSELSGGRGGAITQSEAAAILGVSVRTYQEWEQGRMTPRGIALQAVLERITK